MESGLGRHGYTNTFPAQARAAASTLSLILTTLSQELGGKVGLANLPMLAFANKSATLGASGEPASAVLVRVFEQLSVPRPASSYSYRLLFDPGVKYYMLDISGLRLVGQTQTLRHSRRERRVLRPVPNPKSNGKAFRSYRPRCRSLNSLQAPPIPLAQVTALALEPHLPGIAWETRLANRDLRMRASGHKSVVDRSLFDGHRMILNSINVVLFCLILWVLYTNRDFIAFPAEWKRYELLRYSPALIPLIIIFLGRRGDLKRNGTMEKEQILSWQNPTDADGTPIFAMRPGNGANSEDH
jgi:hypothetical protein